MFVDVDVDVDDDLMIETCGCGVHGVGRWIVDIHNRYDAYVMLCVS